MKKYNKNKNCLFNNKYFMNFNINILKYYKIN